MTRAFALMLVFVLVASMAVPSAYAEPLAEPSPTPTTEPAPGDAPDLDGALPALPDATGEPGAEPDTEPIPETPPSTNESGSDPTGDEAPALAPDATLDPAATPLAPDAALDPAAAPSAYKFITLAGNTRYDTASAIARAAYPSGAAGVIIVSGEGFADALSATALAGLLDYPISIVAKNSIPKTTLDLLSFLKPSQVIIIGGTGVVSAAVATQLASFGSVERLGGATRYETNAAVYAYGAQQGSWADTALVASGANFPDALALAPLAAYKKMPLLLVGGQTLAAETTALLSRHGFDSIIIAGLEGTVSSQFAQQIKTASGITPLRLGGPSRFDTAAKIAQYCVDKEGMSYDNVGLASGASFPDGLTGAPFLSKKGSVLLLTSEGNNATLAALAANKSSISTVYVLGGYGSVAPDVRNSVVKNLAWPLKAGWVNEAGSTRFYVAGTVYVGLLWTGGKLYLLDSTGAKSFGWKRVSGQDYYFNPSSGQAAIGRQSISGRGYYFRSNGTRINNEFVTIDGRMYYYGADGAMYVGEKTIGGQSYYFDSSGALARGWVNAGGWKFYAMNGSQVPGVLPQGRAESYVEVNISQQRLWYVKNGQVVLESDVVTGLAGRMDTPTGSTSIVSKERNVYFALGGFSYYWLAFRGTSYGFHDALWQPWFGGNRYTYGGSHGCVNMPLDKAEALFSLASVGDSVVVHY
ncbi:MAG: cell wall-binding repeat-containing protein [Coriobacteriales bacterium]|nr:cell wall-binding repeat-containing protein [Coriobacteriales bacterium]